jgi:hypothetical protein
MLSQMHDSGRRREKRGGWVVLFFVAGLVALSSAAVLTFNAAAFPFVIVSSPLAAVAGYRIWRIDHPNDSPTAVLRQRLVWYGRAALRAVTLGAIDYVDGAGSSNHDGPGGHSDGRDGF